MGSLYKRGAVWWIGFKDADGAWQYRSTGTTNEKQAKRLLSEVQAQVALGIRQAHGSPTLTAFVPGWLEEREKRGLSNTRLERGRFRDYVLPELGSQRLDAVRPKMVRDLVRQLRAKGLAPRTVRTIYGYVHRLFEDAVADELLEANPCALKRGELPTKADKDPTWRAGALFTRAEAEQLYSDERIPMDRRVTYGLALLGALRLGEISSRRWRDYDTAKKPLGALLVHSSYRRQNKRVKGTKTEVPRSVPVHPTLAALLAEWKLSGWEELFGRKPTAEDLIVPNRRGGFITDDTTHAGRVADFALLGLRMRRLHDMRRTFISLARDDGARADLLKWVTHGVQKSVIDDYTTPTWEALCALVLLLKLGRRGAEVHQLQPVLQPLLHRRSLPVNPAENTSETDLPRARFEGSRPKRPYVSPSVISVPFVRGVAPRASVALQHRSNVVSASAVEVQLEQTLEALRRGDSREALQLELEQLLEFVRGS